MFVPLPPTCPTPVSSVGAPRAVQTVRLVDPIPCTIRSWGVPARPEPPKDGSRTVTVNGRRVKVTATNAYVRVDGVQVGHDGSLLISRQRGGDNFGSDEVIRVGRRETPVTFRGHPAFVSAYRDARKDVASFTPKTGVWDIPMSAPVTYVVRDGRASVVGVGAPHKVFGLDDILLQVPVDRNGQPAGPDETDTMLYDLHRRGRVVRFGEWVFEFSLPGRGLVLTRRTPLGQRLVEWRDGGFGRERRLPKRWTVNARNARGDYLLRGPGPSQGDTGEANWTMGLLRGATLTPFRFPRPKGSERLLRRAPAVLGSDRHVRFTAFYGEVERGYEVRPTR